MCNCYRSETHHRVGGGSHQSRAKSHMYCNGSNQCAICCPLFHCKKGFNTLQIEATNLAQTLFPLPISVTEVVESVSNTIADFSGHRNLPLRNLYMDTPSHPDQVESRDRRGGTPCSVDVPRRAAADHARRLARALQSQAAARV